MTKSYAATFQMFTSLPVWAIITANFAQSWGFYLSIKTIPKYLSKACKRDTEFVLTSIPYIVMTLSMVLGGFLSDFLRKRKHMSDTNVRKVFNSVGFCGQAVCFLVGGLTVNEMALILVTLGASFFHGVSLCGYCVNLLDIAPRHASILVGFSNAAGMVGGKYCLANNVITFSNKNSDYFFRSVAPKAY